MEGRIKEIDYLKCIFIILMIIFHLVYIGDKYPYAKQIVYTFHMSAFLIISGYLANVHKDTGSMLRKLLWIFIPYACMEVGYVVMSHFLPVREGVPEVTPALLMQKIFLKPMGPYWYLHTLIVCSLIYYTVFHFTRIKIISRVILTGLCFFAASYWGGLVVFANAFYFLIGITVSQSKLPFTHIFRATLLAVIPLIMLCCFPENLNRGTLAGVTITYLAISTLLYIYNYLPENVRHLSHLIGRNTLVILLFSPIFTILSKSFLPAFSFDPTGVLFLVSAVTFTLCGCMGIAWTMDKLQLSRFFFGKRTILCFK
jgi:fucose 4-O-acetylase-like acetyltransferase